MIKQAQQTELQVAAVLALRKTHENTKVVFSLNKAIDQWLSEFSVVILS